MAFMVRGISANWKQPLGYFLVNGTCKSDVMEDLVKEAIDKLKRIDLNVVTIVSDMGSNFQSLAKRLNVTNEKPWFEHNSKKYFLMFDPPHLLKSVRNNLLKYSFVFNDEVATWKDIEDFYQQDTALEIRSAPKLTEKHIHPNNFSKMKVKYASQVLSHTVAASICTYVRLRGLPETAMHTANVLLMFDSLFDCFNSSSLHSTKKYKCALSENSQHLGFFEEAFCYIKALQVFEGDKNVTSRVKCLNGWLVTINATRLLWEQLKAQHGFKFLLTRRLNSDALENFFGAIRKQGGNSDNPTPVQFSRAFRKLFCSSFLSSSTGNCAEDFDEVLATVGTPSSTPVLIPTAPKPQPAGRLIIGATDYRETDITLIQENTMAYVSDYLLHKCLRKHSCPACLKEMVSGELNDKNLLCFYTAYDQNTSDFGGLHCPSGSFLQYIIHLENIFVQQFSVYTKTSSVGSNILNVITKAPLLFQCCEEFPVSYLQKLFLRMRIYYCLKFANRDFAVRKKKEKKYIKLAHL